MLFFLFSFFKVISEIDHECVSREDAIVRSNNCLCRILRLIFVFLYQVIRILILCRRFMGYEKEEYQ